jgi:hypothetical protein
MVEEYNIKTMDTEKSKVAQLIKMYNLFVSNKKKEHVHNTLLNTGNPVVECAHKILMETVSNITDHNKHVQSEKDYGRYREMIMNPIEFFLYIFYTDSAYRDIGDFMIWRFKEELKKHPELEEYIDSNAKDIKNCYYNNWEATRMETIEKQKRGELMEGELCDSEILLVDDAQKNKVEDYVKRTVERNKKFEHW